LASLVGQACVLKSFALWEGHRLHHLVDFDSASAMPRWMGQLRIRRTSGAAEEPPARPIHPSREDAALAMWCAEAAQALALPELASRVRVSWNPRMRTTAGRAWWPDRFIELNPKLREQPVEESWRTLKHELAHLVAYERAGRRRIDPHGKEWQLACADLGIPGEKPFHTLPFKRRRLRRKYCYVCPNCSASMQRVKPIAKPIACYSCCRKFNAGVYHSRFRLIETKL
jgi:SprT protein